MSVDEVFALLSSDAGRSVIVNTWTVPAGMLVLYFYGRSHFNTPEYTMELSASGPARLLTRTPPIFTTRRTRFNSYANRYVLILEAAFLIFLFAYSLIQDAADITKLQLPDMTARPLHYRVVFGLFALTGLLSSFPVIKQIDAWLLESLHRKAYIPDDAKHLAENLCSSIFTPPPNVLSAVRATLSMRDTIRVAERQASGALEKRIIDILCLRSQLQTRTEGEQFRDFRITLDRDFRAISEQSQSLRAAVVSYLRTQERVVPATVTDIDAYLDENADTESVSELRDRRQELQSRAESLYETLCLVVALSLFATQFSPEDIDSAIKQMGFTTNVDQLPSPDWETVGLVTVFTFVSMLAFNAVYAVFGELTGMFAKYPTMAPDKGVIIRFAVLYTAAYAIVMGLAIYLKRRWRRPGDRRERPEELLVAIYAYFATVPLNFAISLVLRHGEITYAPLLYALNQAVLGYFIAQYIDRSLTNCEVSVSLAGTQAIAQAVCAVIATTLSPSISPSPFGAFDVSMAAIAAIQSAASGFIIGILFQRLYSRSGNPAAPPTVGSAPAIGLNIERRVGQTS